MCLNASTGLSFEAFTAGIIPNMLPSKNEPNIETTTSQMLISALIKSLPSAILPI